MGTAIWENDVAVAVRDIKPEAPVQIVVIARQHIKNIDALEDANLAGKLLMAVREVIKQEGLVEANKIIIQGIEVNHLHFVVMSDERYQPA